MKKRRYSSLLEEIGATSSSLTTLPFKINDTKDLSNKIENIRSFLTNKPHLPQLKKQLLNVQSKLSTAKDLLTIKELKIEQEKLKNEINTLEQGTRLKLLDDLVKTIDTPVKDKIVFESSSLIEEVDETSSDEEYFKKIKIETPMNNQTKDAIKTLPVEYINYLLNSNRFLPVKNNDKTICKKCNLPLIIDDDSATVICKKCAIPIPHIDTIDTNVLINTFAVGNDVWGSDVSLLNKAKSKEKIINQKLYKVLSQFEQIINRFDVASWNKIPQDIYDKIKEHCDITSLVEICTYLKQNGLKEYIKNNVQIYSELNDIKPPELELEHVEKIKSIFISLMGDPWEKHKGNRKNFPIYILVFKKICQHLHYMQYVPFIDILAPSKSLKEQEVILNNMLADLN